MRLRVVWAGLAVLVLGVLGALAWWLTREKDAIYDDKKAAQELLSREDVPEDVNLPSCSGACAGAVPLEDKHVVVVVTKKELRVPANGLVIPVPADQVHGFDGMLKRSGRNDLYVVKLGDTLQWIHQQLGATSVALMVDRDTTYRLLTEVLFTAGQSEYSRFFLAERQGKDVAWVHQDPPRAGQASPCYAQMLGQRAADKPHLCPTVLVVGDGYSVKARGGNVAPGCQDTGPGIALPKLATGAYDTGGLRQCLARLKAAAPDFADENEVTMTASADVTIGAVYDAIDAAIAVFPEVKFGVAR